MSCLHFKPLVPLLACLTLLCTGSWPRTSPEVNSSCGSARQGAACAAAVSILLPRKIPLLCQIPNLLPRCSRAPERAAWGRAGRPAARGRWFVPNPVIFLGQWMRSTQGLPSSGTTEGGTVFHKRVCTDISKTSSCIDRKALPLLLVNLSGTLRFWWTKGIQRYFCPILQPGD